MFLSCVACRSFGAEDTKKNFCTEQKFFLCHTAALSHSPFNPFATHGHAGLTADRTGKQGQIPIPAGHLRNRVRRQRLHLRHLIAENIAIYICEGDRVPWGEFFEVAKVAGVVMCRNDQIVLVCRAGVPARGDPKARVALLADDGQRKPQRLELQDTDIALPVHFLRGHIHFRVQDIIRSPPPRKDLYPGALPFAARQKPRLFQPAHRAKGYTRSSRTPQASRGSRSW